MTFAGAFLIFALIFFVFMLVIATMPEAQEKKDLRGVSCPPHKWDYIENAKLEDGRTYTGLKCSKCRRIPQQ